MQRCGGALQAAVKAVIGIHVLLTHSLFGDGILRKLLARVSLGKPDFCSRAILVAAQNEASILGLVRTNSREKHTAKPVQFGTAPAFF